jgi:hypothetical protein
VCDHGKKDTGSAVCCTAGARSQSQGKDSSAWFKGSPSASPFAGLDDLRLLGNDAAHTESTAYEQVSQEEVEVAIEFTKEVLKAVYQYRDLLNRMRALKKQPESR